MKKNLTHWYLTSIVQEYVVVQKEGDVWYWPSIGMGHRVEFTVDEGRKVNITTLHMFPRVYEVTNFASAEECDHMIAKSKEKGKMVESYVALHSDNDMQKNESRTSKNVNFGLEGFYLRTDPIFEKLMKRYAKTKPNQTKQTLFQDLIRTPADALGGFTLLSEPRSWLRFPLTTSTLKLSTMMLESSSMLTTTG